MTEKVMSLQWGLSIVITDQSEQSMMRCSVLPIPSESSRHSSQLGLVNKQTSVKREDVKIVARDLD